MVESAEAVLLLFLLGLLFYSCFISLSTISDFLEFVEGDLFIIYRLIAGVINHNY